MTDVGRVHVRCTAPVEEEARALRLRDRLVRTARVHLPDALEQALGGGPERRVFAEQVTVALDFDPDDYDDVTTALLWAACVRHAVDAAGEAGSRAAGVLVFEDDRSYFGAAAVEYAQRGELGWVFEELRCGAGSPAAAAFLSAFDTRARVAALAAALSRRVEAAAALWRRLSPAERRAALEALAGVRAWGDWRAESEAAAGMDGDAAATPTARDAASAQFRKDAPGAEPGVAGAAAAGAGPAAPARPAAGPVPGLETAALDDWLAALARCARTDAAGVRHAGGRRVDQHNATATQAGAERRTAAEAPAAEDATRPEGSPAAAADLDAGTEPEPEAGVVSESWWSSVGGLVLLYPWLADLLAEDVEPGHELAFRSWALAAVLAPEAEEQLLADPLVRVLAGDDPGEPFRPLTRPPEAERIVERAEGVLRSFAAALPGFEASTPGYLRQFLLVRGALVARLPDGEGYGVRLDPAPLDPILVRLPYPLSVFRFAWSAPVHVELRDARG